MITPRRTRLVRVPHLQAFRRAIDALCADGVDLVVVPTRGAARQLERRSASDEARRVRFVTRDELYDALHERLPSPPHRLTALERDAVAQRAAHDAAAGGPPLSFTLRPGLVAELLRFYDELRRHRQQVNRFEELILDALGGRDEHEDEDGIDRGAQRLRVQTRFLAAAFREYERRVRESGDVDEHLLREQLIAEPSPSPVRRLLVTVPDWIADASGLAVADFDLLARIPGLETLDIVATERLLASGFHERLDNWMPGVEAASLKDVGVGDWGLGIGSAGAAKPLLITPPVDPRFPTNPSFWCLRDREEELVSIVRQIKADRRAGAAVPLERVAVVFKHPLPYLYLAAEVLPAAGIRYQTFDALPLAVEPAAAAIDLVLEAAASSFTRATLIALLRSPHFAFGGGDLSAAAIAALDRLLSDRRYLGDLPRLEALAAGWDDARSRTALDASLTIARELAPLVTAAPASGQLQRLVAFWRSHARTVDQAEPAAARTVRARATIEQTLVSLAAVHAAHHDPPWTIDDVSLAVRRAIEGQTFEQEGDRSGVHLLDDQAARYGDFDQIAIVGLVESEWPEKPRRNIFYPPALLKALGWPSEKDRRAADEARFLDLVGSASKRVTLSTFTLEDDALVTRSAQLDDVPRLELSTVAVPAFDHARAFVDEALSLDPAVLDVLDAGARAWAEARVARTDAEAAQFHGAVGTQASRAWSVSALETYLGCPFRFFARHVLKLEEEPDDEEVMDPKRQGRFVHEVFERFFTAWQDAGRNAITPENLDEARALFRQIVDAALELLPEAEAGLERTRLLGSPAAAGLGEAVLRMEAERPQPVVARLLEHPLKGEFRITTSAGERTVALSGKADRIDLLGDGTFRLIDYKLGSAPNRSRALQLPIYGLCAEQRLTSFRGRSWTLGEAAYVAFKGAKRIVPLFSSPADRDKVLADAQQRVADVVDAIERGEFPPTPDDVWRCETCAYAAVCRKDYVGDV